MRDSSHSKHKQRDREVEIDANLEKLVEVDPQAPFITNCMPGFTENDDEDVQILAWNMIGIVSLRKQQNFTSIDVEFADKSMHSQFALNDDFGSTMASLAYGGLALASKGKKIDMDDYEEDEVDAETKIDKACSYLYYKSFKESKAAQMQKAPAWHYKLPRGEHIECIAQGSEWVAAITDLGYLRIFSSEGV